MSDATYLWNAFACGATAIAAAFVVFMRRGSRSRGSATLPHAVTEMSTAGGVPQGTAPAVVAVRADAIVVGVDAQHAAIRIAPLSDDERYRRSSPVAADQVMAGRLTAALQAVPSLLIEETQRGKHLMEVVINGDLVRASGGDGLRAWAVDANHRITEHARLFEVDKLQTVVNAAAVWQIASVVVAQKHLADISAKLTEIRGLLQSLSSFLEEERRAVITGTYEYLQNAVAAIGHGELSPAIRNELESCERELLKVQHHLLQELKRRISEHVPKKESFGTKQLAEDTEAKYEGLRTLANDLRLTLKTRALGWYVLSLYPGEPALKRARMEAVLRSRGDTAERLEEMERLVARDCERLSFPLVSETTVAVRRANVRDAASQLTTDLSLAVSDAERDVLESEALLLTHDSPTCFVLEVDDGKIGGMRIVAASERI